MKKILLFVFCLIFSVGVQAYPQLVVTSLPTGVDTVYAGDTNVCIARFRIIDTGTSTSFDSLEYYFGTIIPWYVFPLKNVKVHWEGLPIRQTVPNWDTANHYFAGHYSTSHVQIDSGVVYILEFFADIPNYNFPMVSQITTSVSDPMSWMYEVGNAKSPIIISPAKVNPTTSIVQPETIEYTVFPNPFKDFVNVKSDAFVTVEIMDINGQVFAQKEGRGVQIDCSALPTGAYVVRLTEKGKEPAFRKLIKQ